MQRKRFKDLLIDFVLGEHPKVLAAEEERNRPEKERWEHLLKDRIKVKDPTEVEEPMPEREEIEPLSHEERWGLLSKEEQKQIQSEAGKRFKKAERTGIPQELFRAARLWATACHEEHVRKERKKASDKGHEEKGKLLAKKNSKR